MSRSQPTNHHSSEPQKRYYIGKDTPRTNIIRNEEMHWTEQLRLKGKDTKVRPPYELGDHDPRIDMDREDIHDV